MSLAANSCAKLWNPAMVRYLLTSLICLLLLPALALGQRDRHPAEDNPVEELQHTSAQERLDEAVEVLREIQSDARMRSLLKDARGIFIVPDYGEASLIIGSGGGEGVLLLREDGYWSNPAFYKAGSLTAGLQAGITAGSLALVLMSEKAAASFYDEQSFSLSLTAGLVVANRSAWARGDVEGDMDVLIWSDTEGLLAEVSVGVNSVIWQPEANQDYYGRPVSPYQVLSGRVVDPNHEALQQALLEQK